MRDGFIAWDEAAIRFAMDFNCFCGGRTVKVVWSDDISRDESAEDADILMYCPENGTLHIIETTLGEEQFEELLPELMAQTKTERLVYDRKGIMVLLLMTRTGRKDCLQTVILRCRWRKVRTEILKFSEII